jgi:hypothetical protein
MITDIPIDRLEAQGVRCGTDAQAVAVKLPPRMVRWMRDHSADPYRFEIVEGEGLKCGEIVIPVAVACRLHASENDAILFRIRFGF